LASDVAPTAAFAPTATVPGISWWYNWGINHSGTTNFEFVPMMANGGAINGMIPGGSRYLLGFNEPNFKAQGNLSPQQAAADWPALQAKAKAAGIPIVSPAVNYCGSASDSSLCTTATITDPYTWLKDFFAACTGCEVDYVGIHWYACDLGSLKSYIEGDGKTFEGFTQFGKPLWLTEFSCDTTHSVADQTAYMKAAIPYLEASPNIFRYSWFSASPIPNAELANADGSLTALGTTYVGLAQSCQP
jgi:putative glycosyl hydrolase